MAESRGLGELLIFRRLSGRPIVVALALALMIAMAAGASSLVATAHADSSLPTGAMGQVGTVGAQAPSEYRGWNWATPDEIYEYATAEGDLAVVKHDGASNQLTIDAYDPATLTTVGATKTIELSGWPKWGGFYAAPDGYFYVLVGQDNPAEDDNLDVVAVRRYDPAWNLVGIAYVKGGASQDLKGIYAPFDAGHPHMVLVGDRLVVHMSRLMYEIENQHHQSNFTFEVNTGTMTATPFGDLGPTPYTSHSFQQLVAMNGTSLVTIDHGDAYPRAIQMAVVADYPTSRAIARYDLFDFNGGIGDNFTGASVTGLISGPRGVVVLGNSIRQPQAPDGPLGSADENRNIFAISADPATGAHTVRWLTKFEPTGSDYALEPRAVQVGADLFAVLFGVHTAGGYQLEYRLLSSAGDILASATFPDTFHATIDDPVVVGTSIYWVGIDPPPQQSPTPAYLYGLDISDPKAPTSLGTPPVTPPLGHFTLTAKPHLNGVHRVGHTLKADGGSWSPDPRRSRFVWFRDGDVISGATARHYLLTRGDRGHHVRYEVTVKKPGYEPASASSKSVRIRGG